MDIFNDIGKTVESLFYNVSDFGGKVFRETKELSRNGKFKLKLYEEQKKLRELYETLGESYYNVQREASYKNTVTLDSLILQIEEVEEKIESMKNMMKFRQFEEQGESKCKNCNEPLSEGARFCSGCGKSVEGEISEGIIYINENQLVTKECPNCKHKVKIDANHCDRCGRSFD